MFLTNRLMRAAFGLVLCLPIIAAAQVLGDRSQPAPQESSVAQVQASDHIQTHPLTAAERPPISSNRAHLRVNYDRPPLVAVRPVANCDLNALATAGAAQIVAVAKAAEPSCVNQLFSIDGTLGAQVFAEDKMVAVADAIAADAPSYPGTNANQMLQLVLFMRAGYYVQWYNEAEVGTYGATLKSAIQAALGAFAASAHFDDVNDNHGEILSEFVTLIDSSAENASQLAVVEDLLNRYDPMTWDNYFYMSMAANNVFTVLYRGHYNEDFRAAVQVAPGISILDTLVNFITDNKTVSVGSSSEYILQNAAGELARFLNTDAYYGYPIGYHVIVHPKAKAVLDQFSIDGFGAGVYVRMAGVIDYYDHADCEYFSLCTFVEDLEDLVLPAANARDCSPTLRVRSQALTPEQLDWVCARVSNEESYFHLKAQTSNVPVADDYNDKLEMIIFHSSTDYATYSGTIFGNSTDNGGIYLEGDPSVQGNTPRFIAYEAEWLRPQFDVWNLTHEYIHYLDGRFNWYGGFGVYPMTVPASAIWYIEGFAEYLSYSYRNMNYDNALAEAQNPDKYTLGQILDNDYNSGQTRVYAWGYLASRFMFERHANDMMTMFTSVSRPGNYTPGYKNWLDSVRTTYDVEFRDWLVCLVAGNGDTSACNGQSPGDAIFADGFDAGAEPPIVIEECTDADTRVLDNGCKRSGLAASSPIEDLWFYISVPSGKSSLTFTMSGGTGDADMYQKFNAWPSPGDYDHASTLVGNDDVISIVNPEAGWHYVLLKAKSSSFEDVQVSAAWTD